MDVLTSRRIVLLGKTGAGKSSLANTIFGEEVFKINHTFNSGTRNCRTETKFINGRSITLMDTPGFFDTDRSEEEMKPEIVQCITECAPGPHAFLIVLKVEKYTEQAVIAKTCQHFSADAFKYAAVVFTCGDSLPEGQKIQEFVSQNENLSELVKRCGGRCHVVDNKYWKNKEEDYKNNKLQVAELLNTVDKMTEANQGSCYTNEMLQALHREIQREEEQIRQTSGKMSQEEISTKAKMSVCDRFMIRSAGIATGVLLGVFLGVAGDTSTNRSLKDILDFLTTAEGREKVVSAAQNGGETGYNAAGEAQSLVEAMRKAAKAVWNQYWDS